MQILRIDYLYQLYLTEGKHFMNFINTESFKERFVCSVFRRTDLFCMNCMDLQVNQIYIP